MLVSLFMLLAVTPNICARSVPIIAPPALSM
jgi:hypothetical protein